MKATIVLAAIALGFAPHVTAQEGSDLSLEPTRTVAFTTTEGTYMNLDVSPDGQSIVFDLLGDIYTMPITGGSATRLTSGMAYDVQPVYSPDGETIAFVSDRSGSDNIWLIDNNGDNPRAVTTEKQERVYTPEWAPDGEYIAAHRGRELWLYHIEGGSGLKMSDDDAVSGSAGPRFSPDGRYLFFSGRSGSTQGIGRFTSWQVKRLDRVTGDVASITASPNGAFRPAVSPDGRWIAYGARLDAKTGIRLRDLRTDREQWLMYDIDRDNAERPGVLDLMPRFTFTPTSDALVLATGGTFHRVELDGTDHAVPFTAEVEQELGPLVYVTDRYTDEPVHIRNIRYANRDAAGDRIIFSALSRLWLQSGNDAPELLRDQGIGQFQPVFSPDGEWAAYVTWDDVEGGHLWKVRIRGANAGEPQRLTEYPGYYLHPSWSPDGSRIAFIKEDAAAFRNIWSRNTGLIVWVDAAGGPIMEVTSAPSDNRLTFSPDGTRLSYVASARPGSSARSEFVSVRLDGTDKRTLANISAETYEAVPSPDGRWLAFGVREDIYLAALPLSAEVPTIGESRGPGPVKRITREGGLDLHWEDDGQTLAWTFADTFYYIDADSAMAAEDTEGTETDATEDTEDTEGTEGTEGAGSEPHSVQITIDVPRHRPTGVVALVGGTAITMESEETIPKAAIIVRNNRIETVAPRDAVAIPDGAEVIDITGQYVMPGLIDLHAHLRPPREVFVETSWSYLANLAYGVTTTRDVSTSNDSFAYAELVETGQIVGPRIYSTGRAMTTTNAKIENLDDARAMVRHYKKLGTNVIKQYMQPHRRQRQWVIQAAAEENMNVTNEGAGDLRLNMTQILDGYTGIEHSLPVADIYDDVITLFAESGTWYTPTLVVSYGGPTAEWYFYQTTEVHDDEKLARFTPHDDLDRRTRRGQMNALEEYHFQAVSEGAARILQRGGKVAMGAHGEQQGICAHWELWALQMGGLSNFDALRTATTLAAEGLGMQEDLGTLTGGKLADLVVTAGNPLDDIRNSNTITYVMKNGELFDGDTLSKVWPEQQDRPPLGYRVIATPSGGSERR